MTANYSLTEIARLPAPRDNVAIATRRLERDTHVTNGGTTFELDSTVLEGHRFALQSLAPGDALLSWGLPFGYATRAIAPGEYVCNAAVLDALHERDLDFEMPRIPNFRDELEPYILDESAFRPGEQVARYAIPRTFMGYPRGGGRGVGTRNHIVILGVTSRAASFARVLAERLRASGSRDPNFDGVVAVAHTEGSDNVSSRHNPESTTAIEVHDDTLNDRFNNRAVLLRTLAGFMVHPNVGAVLAVDNPGDPITNAELRASLASHERALSEVPHAFMSLEGRFEADLARGAGLVEGWFERMNAQTRSPVALSALKIALQCGGSDAFSGISGNPLAGAVAREVIRYGGAANLAETDELVGGESYTLRNVRDLETAQAFLAYIARFSEYLGWHGISPLDNPSSGNRLRGLYNIALKSLGAAMKKDPALRLDYAIDYAERMTLPGFYFMNSPGNDLESVAGQVAAGCNLILFVTGNGSITNFPFVPTVKIVTTTARYELLRSEMDVNAGAYLDGVSMDELTLRTLDLTVDIASGRRSVGERAGHSQVSLWRNWRQSRPRLQHELSNAPLPSGEPIAIRTDTPLDGEFEFTLRRAGDRLVKEQVGLIAPTSLCAGEVAKMAAVHLTREGIGRAQGITRFVALAHTEGCGMAGDSAKQLYTRTMINYMLHPMVRAGLFLEHGCESIHNGYMRLRLGERQVDTARFGWASIQLDGGIERTLTKIEDWFTNVHLGTESPRLERVGLDKLSVGLMTQGELPVELAASLAQWTRTIVAAGGTVIIPSSASVFDTARFRNGIFEQVSVPSPSLAYGQAAAAPGFHIMDTPTRHWVEALTGLGATGVRVILGYAHAGLMQGHPLVPTLQIAPLETEHLRSTSDDFDLVLDGDSGLWAHAILRAVLAGAFGAETPRSLVHGNTDFQMTRGLLGVSV